MKKSLLSFLLMLCCLIGMTTNAFAATSALAAADEEETSWTDWCFTIDDWKALGQGEETWPLSPNGNFTGSYTYTCIFSGTDDNVLVSYRVSLTDPTKAQFRIGTTNKAEQERFAGCYLYWAAEAELIIDCTLGNDESGNTTYALTAASQYTGYENGAHGSLYAADAPNMYYSLTGKWPDKGSTYSYEKNPLVFDPVNGIFTLNLVYYTPDQYIWRGTETFVLDGYVHHDYSMSLTYISGTDTEAVVNFEKGADVASFKYILSHGILPSSEIDGIADAVNEGALPATECTEGGEKTIALGGYGNYTLIVCAYDSNGQFQGTYSTSFTIEDPTEWVSLGLCPYVDDIVGPLFGDDPVEYQVEVEANTKTPGLYRIKNPYGENFPSNNPGDWDASKDYYLVIDATDPSQVFFKEQNLGVDWGYGYMWAISLADYYMSKGYSAEDIAANGYFGKFENGIITFPKGGILLQPGNGTYYQVNSNGAFKLDLSAVLPRDYSISTEFVSGTDTEAIINFAKGADAASFKYVVAENTLTQEEIDSIANGIADGTIESTEITEDGEQTIAVAGPGKYTIVICAYDSEGQCQATTTYSFEIESFDYSIAIGYKGGTGTGTEAIVSFAKGADVASFKYAVVDYLISEEELDSIANGITDGTIESMESTEDGDKIIALPGFGIFTVIVCTYDSEGQLQDKYAEGFELEYPDAWESLGMFTYVDDVVAPYFTYDPVEYQVEVEVNTKVPGLYRIKNPYGENYPHKEIGEYDATQDYYLVIDATNPSQVLFYPQNIGLDYGQGNMWMTSYAAYLLYNGYSKSDIAGMNLFGTLENGVITFPYNCILLNSGDDMYYFTNMNGAFKLDLNVVDAINTIAADKNTANDAYYNLNGVKVAHPTKGIYIHEGKKVFINK